MRYFTYGQNIAAVEDADQAAKYEQAGWEKVSRDAFIDAWRARDVRDLTALPVVPVQSAQPGAVTERLPNGYVRYSV